MKVDGEPHSLGFNLIKNYDSGHSLVFMQPKWKIMIRVRGPKNKCKPKILFGLYTNVDGLLNPVYENQ